MDKKKIEELGYKAFYFMMKFVFVIAVLTFSSILIINSMNENVEINLIQKNTTQIEILETQILNLSLRLEFEKEKNREYNLIIQNQHLNYNNQDERFERMLNWSLEAREELEQMNYRYAMCYEGIGGYRKEDFN